MRVFFDHFVFSKAWGYRLARHFVFWLVYFFVFRIMLGGGKAFAAFAAALWFLPFNLLFVYFVLYRLVPRILMRFAYRAFFAWYCVCLLACLTLDLYWGELVVYKFWAVASHPGPHDLYQTLATIFDPGMFTVVNIMAGLSVGIKIYKFWRAELWMKWQSGQEKARAELELLKGQLQPQFLYNTLTHLHKLVSEGDEYAPQLLLRLSAILSYTLYECRTGEVALEREIAICKEYIALERERQGHWLEVSVDVFGSMMDKRIAPMVLLPFIGNAFSERVHPEERRWMAFEFSVEDDQLLLRIINGADLATGIRNPGRNETPFHVPPGRLQLLYAGRHSLTMKHTGDADILTIVLDLGPAGPEGARAPDLTGTGSLLQYAVFDY